MIFTQSIPRLLSAPRTISYGALAANIVIFSSSLLLLRWAYPVAVAVNMKWLLLPLTGCIVYGLSARTDFKYKLAVLQGACALVLALALIILPRTMGPDYRNHLKLKLMDPSWDARTKLQVLKDFRKQGFDAYPGIPSGSFRVAGLHLGGGAGAPGKEVIPLGSISRVLTVMTNETGQYLVYPADEFGFHNPLGLYKPGAQVLMVGDSFTQGLPVLSSRNMAAHIRKVYPLTLTLGFYGNGPLTELATIREYGSFLKPKVVLWCYFEGNDIVSDLGSEKRSILMLRYLEKDFSQGLMKRQPEIDRAMKEYVKSRFTEWVPRSPGNIIDEEIMKFRPADLDANVELFRDVLNTANREVSAWGGKMYFVYLPAWERYQSDFSEDGLRQRVLDLVGALGMPVIDLHPAFMASGDPLAHFPNRNNGHYNEAGYKLASETILSAIRRLK